MYKEIIELTRGIYPYYICIKLQEYETIREINLLSKTPILDL